MSFPVVRLSDLCVMDRQGLGPDNAAAALLPYVGVENVESHNGTINFANGSRVGNQKSTTFQFDERHVLYGKLRPYLNKVATPDFAGKCSTELIPLLPKDNVDREFIAYLLRRNQTVEYAMASVTGSRMPRTDMKALMSLPVPLPPLEEQRRIVAILNRAAKIDRLRKQAQNLLQEFIPALFVKMFGDPATNPMGWETAPFVETVKDVTRNASKIQRKNYCSSGEVPIVDQGKQFISGYSDCVIGGFSEPLPVIVFGDHTRRFKLIRKPFFLGADGAKILTPISKDLDVVFLYGQLLCLKIDDSGYSRHFKFLKRKILIVPPKAYQISFRKILEQNNVVAEIIQKATKATSLLSPSLMSHLLEDLS